MMPGHPVSHLIVRQTGFSFGSLEAFLDAMSCLGHPSEFRQWHVIGRIRQIVIMLISCVRLPLSGHKQCLVRSGATRVGSCLDTTLYRFDYQWSFLPVPHIDLGPRVLGKHRAPVIYSHEGSLGMSTPPRIFRRWHVDVTDQRVRRDRKQVTFALGTQIQPKTAGAPHLIVARDPGMRQYIAKLRQHLQRQLMASLKLDCLGYPGCCATRLSFVQSSGR